MTNSWHYCKINLTQSHDVRFSVLLTCIISRGEAKKKTEEKATKRSQTKKKATKRCPPKKKLHVSPCVQSGKLPVWVAQ